MNITSTPHTPKAGTTPGWELWRSFLAVAQQGSLSGAARALGLTQPSVSRHIQLLEQQLHTNLFTRSRQGLQPTALAQQLLPQAQAMAAAAAQLERTAASTPDHASGTVRITASEIVGTLVLPPMLAAFREAHPAIRLELALSNRTSDMLQREADIAVRMLRPTQTALIARHVGDVQVGLFAHARYAAAHGLPPSVDALRQHALIGVDRDTAVLRHPALQPWGLHPADFALRCDSDVAQLALLKAGAGIGACHLPLAAAEPDFIPVLAGSVGWHYPIWLVMHEDQRATPAIRLLWAHLAEQLSTYSQKS